MLEWQREAGVELVANRIRMTADLGGDAVVMHFPRRRNSQGESTLAEWDAFRRSLNELAPICTSTGVRIAIENSFGDFDDFLDLFHDFSDDVLGLCYDSGHGNMSGNEIPLLDQVKDRLIAVHLHDNNGIDDQHRIPFDGTLPWESLASVLAASAYNKPLNLEVVMGSYGEDTDAAAFLASAFAAGQKLTAMVAAARDR